MHTHTRTHACNIYKHLQIHAYTDQTTRWPTVLCMRDVELESHCFVVCTEHEAADEQCQERS